MNKSKTWELTISYWPNAAKNNVRPIKSYSYAQTDDYTGYYRPIDFLFNDPPSRDDFGELVAITPWLRNQDFLPVLIANNWPIVSIYCKASQVDLKNETGQVVGQIEVRRQTVYHGHGYHACDVDIATRNKVVNRLPVNKRKAAQQLIFDQENWILEQVSMSETPDQHYVEYKIRCLLYQAGLLKTNPPTQTP